MAGARTYRLYQKYIPNTPFSLILENTRNSEEFLLFEAGVVASLNSNECDEFKRQYTKVSDCFGCLGVLQLHETDKQFNYLSLVTACLSVGKIEDADVYKITAVQFFPMWTPLPPGCSSAPDERITEIQKLICSGTFYFAVSSKEDSILDLSLCAQKRYQGCASVRRFFWNRRLHLHFQRYGIDTNRWLLRCICGGVEIKTVYVGNMQAKACLISRLSCERMGTRFNVRGVNDSGNVANFVETEQVVFYDCNVVSFVQTRGSVPLFWEQPGVQIGSHKVKFSRGFEASAPAYDRHFKQLKRIYSDCVVVNLLGNKEGEKLLSQAFATHHENSSHRDTIPYVYFDYHAMVRQNNKPQNLSLLWDKVKNSIQAFGFFHAKNEKILRLQTGQVRTNCLDCLDRTNCAQSFFALNVLVQQLEALDLLSKSNIRSRFEETYRQLWTLNGDQCSKIYAGTGALEGKSKIKDAHRSVTRTIQNNLMDGSKQEAMDLFLLGTGLNSDLYDKASALLPVDLMQTSPNILSSIVNRAQEFTVNRKIRVFCGTWNVNGGQRLNSVVFRRDASLTDWLLDFTNDTAAPFFDSSDQADMNIPIDIYAIGLEEIVDLNASNIVNASSSNHKMWSDELKRALSRDHRYVILNSVTLVGVSLFVFIRPQLAPFIKEVACDIVKTGLGGAAGNKGGVAIRFVLHSTSVCFLCSHFAAGQSQVQERNNDFQEICKKMQFPMGRQLFSHDAVFWVGDFNYRIDLSGDDVKQLVKDKDWDQLIASDQLTNQRKAGNVFNDFNEGPLNFAPTYKYDTFSDDYDTSEKCRTPAWTDRILWWQRTNKDSSDFEDTCNLLWYNRTELKTSDHRPVGALFDLLAKEVDEKRRNLVYKSIVESTGPADATVLVSVVDSPSTFPSALVDEVLQKTAALGVRILLVKFVGPDMWLICGDGEMALAALSMDGTWVGNNQVLKVSLRSPNWEDECEKELNDSCLNDDTSFASSCQLLMDTEPNSAVGSQFSLLDIQTSAFLGETVTKLSVTPFGGASPEISGRSTPNFQQPGEEMNELAQKKSRPGVPPKRPPPPRNIEQQSIPPSLSQSQQFVPSDPWGADKMTYSDTSERLEKVGLYPELNVLSAGTLYPPLEPVTPSSPGDQDWADFLQERKMSGGKIATVASAPDISAVSGPPNDFDPWSAPLPDFPSPDVSSQKTAPPVCPQIPPRQRPDGQNLPVIPPRRAPPPPIRP